MNKKYKIEGNIDFFSELYKSLEQEDNNNDDAGKCLITNEDLTDRYVKLVCGHSFNYLPLLYDIKNHKEKFNNFEGSHTKLKQDEIRCPYCRNRQTEVLPYYEDLYADKINGVNCIIPFLNYPNYSNYKPPNSIYGNCCYKIDDTYFCNNKYVYNFEDGKTYCYTHTKVMMIKVMKDVDLKKKEEAKKAKLKAKEEAKQAKLKEKEEVKQAKLKAKEAKKAGKNNVTEIINLLEDEQNEIVGHNEIVGQNEIVGHNECIEILKSGINKGKLCCKIIFNNNLCKRHFEKLNKQTI
jgi:hypothetical protein